MGKPITDPILRYDATYGSYYSLNAGTGTAHPGQFNIAIGDDVLVAATEGQADYNVGIGQRVLYHNTVGRNNVAIGWEALRENTGGADNVGISEDALRDNQSGGGNVAIGRGAMISNLTGSKNTAIGYNALQNQKGSNENVAIGVYAGAWHVKGDGNVFIGTYGGECNGSDNVITNGSVCIGQYAGLNPPGSGSICIGRNTQTSADNQMNIGNTIFGSRIGLADAVIQIKGDLFSNSITVGGKKITADDDFIYVQTTTGIKKIALT